MAKHRRRHSRKGIGDYAEDLGTFLGNVEANVKDWSAERNQIGERLLHIRDSATRLLTELGHQFEEGRKKGAKRGRPAGKKRAKSRCKICGTVGHNARGHAKWKAAKKK